MNPVEAMEYLRNTAMINLQEPYKALCLFAITKYGEGYGGAKHHHAYKGGLAVHTAEVVQYCLEMAGPGVDKNVLLTAAYWHDYAKLYEYQFGIISGKIEVNEYCKTIGHVVGSTYYFLEGSAKGLLAGFTSAVVHCMLAHHGRREWGSPVEPATREAWILHAADMMSSHGGAI
jgi:3'-5' exoribonuclease